MLCVQCFRSVVRGMNISAITKQDDAESVGRMINRTSSLSFSVGEITDPPDVENLTHFSVTTILNYCKTKILRPYLRLLSFTGLRSFTSDQRESLTFRDYCSYMYISILFLLMLVGYLLQYMACFRRDRGFGYVVLETSGSLQAVKHNRIYESVCNDSIVFSYVIPHVLHFCGYVYAFLIFRSSDDDQLPSLMETVFLSLSHLSNSFQSQSKLVKTLWIFVTVGLIWMILSLVTVNVMMSEGMIEFKWLHKTSPPLLITLKVLLIVSTLWHDIIQATVISNYCLQGQLLTSYIQFLKPKLLQHSVMPLDWMKDIEEFKKLLAFLNEKLAPAVCLFTLVNICRSITGILWLLDLDRIDKENACIVGINILNVILWIIISLAPFLQAARLSNSCEVTRGAGHEIRTSPFLFQDTADYKLDSLMIYTSSLRMKASLFGVPIKANYLYFMLTIFVIALVVLGQLHYFKGSI